MKNGRLSFQHFIFSKLKKINEIMNLGINKKFSDFTHSSIDRSQIVDISKKNKTLRTAKASCKVIVNEDIINSIKLKSFVKGDIFKTAEIAGIMAAKKTSELIPMCHQIKLSHCSVKIDLNEKENNIVVYTEVSAFENTGVEMEAIVSCSIAAATLYDMCKSIYKGIIITDVKLLEKTGGKSGDYKSI